MFDLMRDVKKVGENKNLFYSYRLNSILTMKYFYEILGDDS